MNEKVEYTCRRRGWTNEISHLGDEGKEYPAGGVKFPPAV
jgi:hypothetical protein